MDIFLIICIVILLASNYQLHVKVRNTDRYLGGCIIELEQNFDKLENVLRGRVCQLENDTQSSADKHENLSTELQRLIKRDSDNLHILTRETQRFKSLIKTRRVYLTMPNDTRLSGLRARMSQIETDFRILLGATMPTNTQIQALESKLLRRINVNDELTRKDIKELFSRLPERIGYVSTDSNASA